MTLSSSPSPRRDALERRYLAVLPRIVRHARIVFRCVRCWHTRQDKIQEVRALCWRWVRQLHRARRKWWTFVSRLADYACRAVKSGRKVAGSISIRDVMNEISQARRGYYIGKFPDIATESANSLTEALSDNTRSPVPDQVQFRCDFPAWLATLGARDRQIIADMARGEKTKHLAANYGVSPGRISQLRRRFHDGWEQFCAGPAC
jgi:hypothetical protein